MKVLAIPTITSVFTVMCSCLQSLLAHAQENFGHFQKSPVAKEGFVGRTMNMCFCDVVECRTSRVPMCLCRDLFVSVQSVCRTDARYMYCATVYCLFLQVDSSLTAACMDIAVLQEAMSMSLAWYIPSSHSRTSAHSGAIKSCATTASTSSMRRSATWAASSFCEAFTDMPLSSCL